MRSPVRAIPSAEAARLAALHALNLLDAPPNERFERVVDAAQQEFGVPIACIMLVDQDRQWMAAGRGPLPRETSTDGSICRTALWSPETFVVPDTTLEPRFATSQYVTGDPHLRFYAAQPLYAPTGEPVGTLCVMDTAARELADDQVRSLAELGRWAQNEIFATVAQSPGAAVRERLQPTTTADNYAMVSLPAPAAARTDTRIYDWSPVPHGLLLGIGSLQVDHGRTTLAGAAVRSALRGAQVDPDPAVALEVAVRRAVDDLVAVDASAEIFFGRLDTVDGRFDHVSHGRSLAVVFHEDRSWVRLDRDDQRAGDHPDPPRSLVGRGRQAARRARAAMSGQLPVTRATPDPAGTATGPRSARAVRLEPRDTLVCCTEEWSDFDDATLDALAEVAATRTLRDFRAHLQDLQPRFGGACGLLLRHESVLPSHRNGQRPV